MSDDESLKTRPPATSKSMAKASTPASPATTSRTESAHEQRQENDDESLITPAMEAAIGTEGEAVTATLEAGALQQVMEALEEDDQELLDAVASGDRSAPMPTYALLTMSRRQEQMSVPDAPSRALMASEAWTVSKPIHLGDELRIQPRIAEIQERIGGRVGHSLFVHHEWVYSNAATGEELARVRRTIAHFKEQHTGE